MSKQHFLGYAGRYIRRLPIFQRRILKVRELEVVYQVKDTRQSKDTKTKTLLETRCRPAEFVAMFSQHVPESVPADATDEETDFSSRVCYARSAATTEAPETALAESLMKHFGVTLLLDEFGHRMHWVGYRQPVPVS
jgi:hypothetical protein